jgi:hypothetical protein
MLREQLTGFRAVALIGLVATVVACGSSAGSTTPTTQPSSALSAAASAASPTTAATGVPGASGSGPATSPTAGASVAGPCGVLTAAEIKQFADITVTGMTDIGGACAYLSASGSHSATKDKRYLAGKDGVIIGVIPTPASSLTCPTRPVQGAATSAFVCNLPGPEALAIFKAASGAFVELNIFSSATLTDAQIDGLVVAAYGRM